LKEHVRELNLTNVQFRPYQQREDLANSLSLPDVHLISLLPELEGLIVPSKYYGIAAAGRPALHIGDTEGEIGSLIRSHACGLAVEVGHSAQAVAFLRSMAEEPGKCARLGANARVLFEGKFDKNLALAAWHRLLVEDLHQVAAGKSVMSTHGAEARPWH
jgi:hypothetical protein